MGTPIVPWKEGFEALPDNLAKQIATEAQLRIQKYLARRRFEGLKGVSVDVVFKCLKGIKSAGFEALPSYKQKADVLGEALNILKEYHPYGARLHADRISGSSIPTPGVVVVSGTTFA